MDRPSIYQPSEVIEIDFLHAIRDFEMQLAKDRHEQAIEAWHRAEKVEQAIFPRNQES